MPPRRPTSRWMPFGALAILATCGHPPALPPGPDLRAVVMPNSPLESLSAAQVPLGAIAISPAVPPATSLRSVVSLNGSWRYRPDPDGRGTPGWADPALDDGSWDSMPVPSNMSVLDPRLARNYGPVWFRTTFEAPAGPTGGSALLAFEGVDYFSQVWLDGRLLAHDGAHEGGFTPIAFDVTPLLRGGGRHVLAVRVTNPYDAGLADRNALQVSAIAVEKIWPKGIFDFHDLRPGGVMDPDDAQSMGTGGIDRPVEIVERGPVSIDGIWVTPFVGPPARLVVDVLVRRHGAGSTEADLGCWLDPPPGGSVPAPVGRRLTLLPGASLVRLEIPFGSIPPVRWWTWDHPELGGPALYTLHAALLEPGTGIASDTARARFGFRDVEAIAPDPEVEGYRLNGVRLFLRGTNYIATEWPYDWDLDRFRRDAALLKAGGFNFVRVHAHLEPQAFYDAMDEAGIGITQDLPLQWDYSLCDFERPDGDPALTSNPEVIRRLAAEAVLEHYNHPSLWIWTAHNEPAHAFKAPPLGGGTCPAAPVPMGEAPLARDPTGNRTLDDGLVSVMSRIDPFRPVHRASGEGDEHSYEGWYVGRYTDVFPMKLHFPTEFGAQGVPWSSASWMSADLGGSPWPITTPTQAARWYDHDFQIAVSSVHIGAAQAPPEGCYASMADWIFASQLYQATLIKAHVEQFRRERFQPTAGFTLFTFQSWWDSVTWGIVDAEREPLLAYDWLGLFNQPVFVGAADPEPWIPAGSTVTFPVTMVNDLFEPLSGLTLTARLDAEAGFLLKGAGRPEASPEPPVQGVLVSPPRAVWPLKGPDRPTAEPARAEVAVDLPADSAQTVETGIRWTAPTGVTTPQGYTLYMELHDPSGALLAGDWYHFAVAEDPQGLYDDPSIPGCLSPPPRFRLTVRVLDSSGAPRGDLMPLARESYTGTAVALSPSGTDWAADDLPPGVYQVGVQGPSGFCSQNVRLMEDRLIVLALGQCS